MEHMSSHFKTTEKTVFNFYKTGADNFQWLSIETGVGTIYIHFAEGCSHGTFMDRLTAAYDKFREEQDNEDG